MRKRESKKWRRGKERKTEKEEEGE
ncbi:uncharacterized protein G2W53_026840 [Senna tora]|uniref:Uncharacterized protein n=1 Tax=Senna tora TaxID=362788 RepID=A0A834TGE3_9FABA|nr:uncharacterized protein G2W53_026840 [Senna tora]